MITKGKMSSYNTNTSEIPAELARENKTSVHVKKHALHVRRSPLTVVMVTYN